jgi:hypothetical protein
MLIKRHIGNFKFAEYDKSCKNSDNPYKKAIEPTKIKPSPYTYTNWYECK